MKLDIDKKLYIAMLLSAMILPNKHESRRRVKFQDDSILS